jgi:hypothetical protein
MTDVGVIRARMELSNAKFLKSMEESRQSLRQTGKTAQRTSKEMSTIQKASGVMASAILASVGASVTVAATFEQSMSKLAGITNASTEELARLESAAREMGATTQFSARNNWPVAK